MAKEVWAGEETVMRKVMGQHSMIEKQWNYLHG